MKKTKVLFIINNLNVGGAETFLVLLIKYLKRYKDIEIVVVSMTGRGVLDKELAQLGVRHKIFNYRLFLPYIHRYDPFLRPRLLWFVFKEKPDVIHGHLLGSDLASKLLGGIFKIPVVVTQHDTLASHPGGKHFFSNRYLKKAIAVSSVVAEYLNKVFKIEKDKIVIVPDAIEIEKFEKGEKNFDLENPVFMYIGRLIELKGVHFAMEALSKLTKDYPKLKFLIVGDSTFGDYKEKLHKLKNDNGWDFIEFLGKSNDVPASLTMTDIFVLPSQTEGFSIAVLEACAAKKPVIATSTGAIPEMVKDGESGFIVQYGDVEAIYRSARTLLENGLVEKFGEKANRIAKEKFGIEKVAEMHYNLYLEVKRNENI